MDRQLEQRRLFSTMVFALRHQPARFDLDLDDEGWADFQDLVIALRFERYEWAALDEPQILAAIAGTDRFEIRQGRIRAVYGHSIDLGKPPPIATPPALLFHGTSSEHLPNVLLHGILRMRRRFVHLSTDYDWVVDFLRDKAAGTILAVPTAPALDEGVVFRKANDHVWLTDSIAPRFLRVHSVRPS